MLTTLTDPTTQTHEQPNTFTLSSPFSAKRFSSTPELSDHGQATTDVRIHQQPFPPARGSLQ